MRGRAFTLVELMTALAVIAVLAVIALPSFVGASRKARDAAEVGAMFNDLRIKLEQYRQEHGSYPASIGEGTLHPVGSPSTPARSVNPLPAAWQALKVRVSGNDHVYCGYTWVAGAANDDSNIGLRGRSMSFAAPSVDWYYVLAVCQTAVYFSSSVDQSITRTK